MANIIADKISSELSPEIQKIVIESFIRPLLKSGKTIQEITTFFNSPQNNFLKFIKEQDDPITDSVTNSLEQMFKTVDKVDTVKRITSNNNIILFGSKKDENLKIFIVKVYDTKGIQIKGGYSRTLTLNEPEPISDDIIKQVSDNQK